MGKIKAWMQVLGAVVMAIWAALTDTDTADRVTSAEAVLIASLAVGAIGTYIVGNLDTGAGHYAKGVVSFLTAALPALSLSLAGGLTTTEVWEALVVGFATTGLVTGVGEKGYVFATKRLVGTPPTGSL
jgi:uncharacterized membrane protein YhhN